MSHPGPLMLCSRATLMQRAGDWLRRGYRHVRTGEVTADRVQALVAKFTRLYGIQRSRNQRARDQLQGQACAALLLYSHLNEATAGTVEAADLKVTWVLLVTNGDGVVHKLERLVDGWHSVSALQLWDYELVRLPRRDSDHPAWTWRLTRQAYEDWRARVLQCCRHGSPGQAVDVDQILSGLVGFAGVREQVKKLRALLAAEHARRFRIACPKGPHHRYVRRLPSNGLTLRGFAKMISAERSAAPQPVVDNVKEKLPRRQRKTLAK